MGVEDEVSKIAADQGMEQAVTAAANLATMYGAIYNRLIAQGVSKEHATQVVVAWVRSGGGQQ